MKKKLLTSAALAGVLVFGSAAGCGDAEPREYYPVEITDCDKDDRSPHWEVADCGPSPAASNSPTVKRPSSRPTRSRG